MKRKLRRSVTALFLAAALVFMTYAGLQTALAATYRQGSSGQTVVTIQTKLKNWGYYTGAVDGIYGSATVKAVKYFQQKNGLTADGICGPATLKALGITTTSSLSHHNKKAPLLGLGFNPSFLLLLSAAPHKSY